MTYTYKNISISVLVGLLLLLGVPHSSQAQTVTFQPQTERERQAYLYGQLIYLQQLRDALEEIKRLRAQSGIVTSVQIETRRADLIEATTAYLQAEVIVPAGERVDAWFEYGQDDDFLGLKTRQTRIDEAYDRAVRTQVTRLEDDERYYYRVVVEDMEGNVRYGNISQFRTDELDN